MAVRGTKLSDSVKNAARLKMQQQLAATILLSMAEAEVDYETLDRVSGSTLGFSRNLVTRLTEGKVKDLHMISDLALALHKDAMIGFLPPRPEGYNAVA